MAQPGVPRGGPPRHNAAPVTYHPEELCKLSGTVLNAATGAPLNKASVTLMRTSGPNTGGFDMNRTQGVSTDAMGRFQFDTIEPGQYRISVRRNGYVNSDQSRRRITPSATLTLSKGQEVRGIEARLLPHAVVTGRVVDADGEPVMHGNIQLLRDRFNQQGQRELVPMEAAQSNDLGEFRLFGVPAGKYFVAASQSMRGPIGFQSGQGEVALSTYYPSASEAAQATAIDVPTGAMLQGIDIRMLRSRAYRLSGKVTGISAGARNGGMVFLHPHSAGTLVRMDQGFSGPWRPDGSFVVGAVPPGSYTIIADSFDGNNRLRGLAEVQVGDGPVENVQVALQSAFELAATVTAEGETKPDFKTMAVYVAGRERTGRMGGGGGGRVEEDGKVPLKNIPAGHYDVNFNGLPSGYYVKSIRAAQTEIGAGGIRAVPGLPIEILLSPRGARVTGTVANEKNEPATNGFIVLYARGDNLPPFRRFKTTSVDQQGRFELSGIAPGDYALAAVDEIESGAVWDPAFLTQNESKMERFLLREDATEQKTLKLIATGQ